MIAFCNAFCYADNGWHTIINFNAPVGPCVEKAWGLFVFCLSNNLLEFFQFFVCRCPAGDETADGAMTRGLSPMGKLHLLRESLYQSIRKDDKLLVGGGVDIELKTFLLKQLFHPHCHFIGMASKVEIEVISKECLELQTN